MSAHLPVAVFPDAELALLSPSLVAARFARPKPALADVAWNGGWLAAAPAVANHQMLENAFDSAATRDAYCRRLLALHHLPPATALQLTAAAVAAGGCEQGEATGARITVFVSAGVRSNAVCAGDRASYEESSPGVFPRFAGTINTLVFLDARLADSVFPHVFTVVAEAKAHALRLRRVRSCYSRSLATGTGTDTTVVVANPGAARAFTTASTHSRLGMVLARATRAALATALNAEAAHA